MTLTQRLPRVMLVAGTRPESLKLASLAAALRRRDDVATLLVNSGQHAGMVEQTWAHLGLRSDLRGAQIHPVSLSHALKSLQQSVRTLARETRAELLVVQGDTTTAYAASLAARDLGIPLAHVEAGLRTGHPYRPFPEELFRRRIARIAALHFAPSAVAADNLRAEKIADGAIHQVGNPGIDLLRCELPAARALALPFLPAAGELIVLTLHRRENYGRGLDLVCTALLELLARRPECTAICPVHPNPVVGTRLRRRLTGHARIVLVEPLPYRLFIALLARARLAITDSGGIQEEAPYLGLRTLLVRQSTERPESVASGAVTLVPPNARGLVAEALRLLDQAPLPAADFCSGAPHGDGRSGERIAHCIARYVLDRQAVPVPA